MFKKKKKRANTQNPPPPRGPSPTPSPKLGSGVCLEALDKEGGLLWINALLIRVSREEQGTG